MIVYEPSDTPDRGAKHLLAGIPAPESTSIEMLIDRLLATARDHLEMDVSFVSRIEGDAQTFEYLAGPVDSFGLESGAQAPKHELYCERMLDGRIPGVVGDVRANDELKSLAVTDAADIGAYVGVPISLPGGELYGTLCCISHDRQEGLGPRDAKFLNALAQMMGEHLAHRDKVAATRAERVSRIQTALSDGVNIIFQPIFDLATHSIVGFEALSRFAGEPLRPPNVWFAEAAEVGLGVELELAAARAAIEHLDEVPADAYVSINFSPAALMSPDFRATVAGAPATRIVIELTEHTEVVDYAPLSEKLAGLRREGYRLAIDDAGAGFSSFAHILRLAPDVIKLDRDLVAGIDLDASQRAFAAALVTFSGQMNARIVAEGVENAEELSVLHDLGIGGGQGFFLARPAPLCELLETMHDNRLLTYEKDAAA
jgi:EAL domain-containing protein (putative c-di-GMP-specific phosphodiesterase class I)